MARTEIVAVTPIDPCAASVSRLSPVMPTWTRRAVMLILSVQRQYFSAGSVLGQRHA